jgi:hypothetical protein
LFTHASRLRAACSPDGNVLEWPMAGAPTATAAAASCCPHGHARKEEQGEHISSSITMALDLHLLKWHYVLCSIREIPGQLLTAWWSHQNSNSLGDIPFSFEDVADRA